MYVNYGDKDFFQCGILVDSDHSDSEFDILYCRPYDDSEDLYQFADCKVDLTDTWIKKKEVMNFIGMKEEPQNNEDRIRLAIGCIDYYGPENFGAINYAYDWARMTREDISSILKCRLIASDNLDISW